MSAMISQALLAARHAGILLTRVGGRKDKEGVGGPEWSGQGHGGLRDTVDLTVRLKKVQAYGGSRWETIGSSFAWRPLAACVSISYKAGSGTVHGAENTGLNHSLGSQETSRLTGKTKAYEEHFNNNMKIFHLSTSTLCQTV